MATPLTIVFQPFATAWLGHSSRLIAIAQAIRRRQPEARLPFLVEGNSGPLLEQAGFPHFCLPHRTEFAGLEWSCWSGEERDGIMNELGKCLLDHLQPQVVVFDSPACSYLVDHVRHLKVPTVLCARKTRTATRTFEWAQTVFPQVDLILVPHEIGEVWIPPDIAARTHFVGPIVRLSTHADNTTPVKSDSPLVVVTGGGGGFPGTVDFYNLALSAFQLARSTLPAIEGILVAGPMFKEWNQLKLVEGIVIVPFDPELGTTLRRADVVICQAGYNTLLELSLFHTPVICVPAPRVADNQLERACQYAQRRANFTVFNDSSAELLNDHILRCLAMRTSAERPESPPPQGADRAADLILSLLK